MFYSAGYAEFVATFERVVGLPPLERYLFIRGRRTCSRELLESSDGLESPEEHGAGHGDAARKFCISRHAVSRADRYTMSLTNTDPRKTDLFCEIRLAPRLVSVHRFLAAGAETRGGRDRAREQKASARSASSSSKATSTFARSLSSDPQGEGGDNHFSR